MRILKKKPIQIYIEPQQDSLLSILARNKGISKAEIIRESLERYFREIPLKDDPAMGIVALGHSRQRDLSERHDEYIARYARKKSE